MEKINFQNNTSPYINDVNLNKMQDNIENAINDIKTEVLNTEIYSTNEIKTNKVWIDGKPIYRKTYTGNMIEATASAYNLLDISSLNFDKIWIDNTVSFYEKLDEMIPINFYYTSTDWSRVWINKSGNFVRIRTGSNLSNYNYILTLEYTKTTD